MSQQWCSGYILSHLSLDLLIFSLIVLLLHRLISMFNSSRQLTKQLDTVSGFHLKKSVYSSLHWLKGHTHFYPQNEEGFLKAAGRTSHFPGLFNFQVVKNLSFLHLYHPEVIKPVLASSAPKGKWGYTFLEPWIGKGLLTSSGKHWHRHRRLITPAFHFNILTSYIPIFNNCAREMLDKWATVVDEPIEVFKDVGFLTLNTMMQCAMSSDTDCQNAVAEQNYIKAVQMLGEITMLRFKYPFLLIDWIFWISPVGWKFRKQVNFVHVYTEKIIKSRRNCLKTDQINTESNDPTLKDDSGRKRKKLLDFIDILLKAKDEDGSGLSDKEIRDEVDTFLFEGHDTTSSGISWALYNLAKYPGFQEQCRKEVQEVIGNNLNVQWSDLPKLEYLTMFIKESLRLYPPVWLIARQLEEDLPMESEFNKSGGDIPKGTSAVVHIFTLHRNVNLWEKVEEFIPERFSKENTAKRPPLTYLPFSAGSRNCIGQNFASNEMKVVLAQALRRYKMSLDNLPTPEMSPQLVLKSTDGIYINFKPI
ncbi:unnamed protein product [Clavelina lepadiformis]|uniref:Cytochrome P450 n=1 Tax=Clavelina lepadiformis TaxID=159417 RepID=A0ABP0FHX8_CLALP